MYDEGEGTAEDNQAAIKWYTAAAEQGERNAQYNLAIMYDEGEGTREDNGEAIKWYTAAASQGEASAMFNLAIMYMNGEGIRTNNAMAYMLFALSAGQGLEGAREARDVMAEELSASQLKTARRAAAEWTVGEALPSL